MNRQMLKSKIHRARITHSDVNANVDLLEVAS